MNDTRTHRPLTDTCPMPIGKHAGVPMIDLPLKYLEKLYEIHIDSPRVYRGEHWIRVITWIQSKRS
jgi:NDP-sugar pyrophosphorylase family protein